MSTLHDELMLDPEQLGYAELILAGSHNWIVDLLNRKQFQVLGPLPIADFLAWMAPLRMMARLRTAMQSEDAQISSIAETALLLVNNTHIPAIDFGRPDVVQMLEMLTAAGVVTTEERDALFGLATVSRSRAEVIGLGYVDAGDVARALAEG